VIKRTRWFREYHLTEYNEERDVMITCKGTIKGNIVILENNAMLPEGSIVEVKVLESEPDLEKRKVAIDSIMALGEKLKGRGINLSRYITEAREELEKRV
jgi:hypothetical protein